LYVSGSYIYGAYAFLFYFSSLIACCREGANWAQICTCPGGIITITCASYLIQNQPAPPLLLWTLDAMATSLQKLVNIFARNASPLDSGAYVKSNPKGASKSQGCIPSRHFNFNGGDDSDANMAHCCPQGINGLAASFSSPNPFFYSAPPILIQVFALLNMLSSRSRKALLA